MPGVGYVSSLTTRPTGPRTTLMTAPMTVKDGGYPALRGFTADSCSSETMSACDRESEPGR